MKRWSAVRRPWSVAFTIALLFPATTRAQGAYVPLDDVAYVYIDALIARGDLRGLSVLERPYSVAQLRTAVTRSSRRTSYLQERLLRAIGKYDFVSRQRADFAAEASASVWATAETSGRRELMLADDVDPAAYFGGAARLLMRGGPIVAFGRPVLDNRLNSDPEFSGRKDRRIAGRVEDAYVRGQWRYGELFFGRAARNWGPHPLEGLLISSAPFTYDHLFGRLGTPRFNLSTLLARLDTDTSGAGPDVNRYLAAHRLTARWRWLEASVAESFVYSGSGRGFEPSLANPLNVFGLSWRNEGIDGNLVLSGQLAARTRAGVFSGEVMLDDIQIDRCDSTCKEPSSYAATVSAEGVPLFLDARAFASYTRVSSLAYRTPNPGERYSAFGAGIGRGFSDYDELKVGLDVLPLGIPLRAYVARRRQGEGDFRAPFPAETQYATHPGIFEGVTMRVTRIGLSGGRVLGDFDVRGDVGFNHRSGRADDDGFEGRVRLSWNPRWAAIRLAP